MTPAAQKAYDEALRRIKECKRERSWKAGLDLSTLGLTTLPPEISQLTALPVLFLDDNHLRALPPEIGELTALTGLYLSQNHLSELPPEIGRLTALTQLVLSGNQLSTLPPEIGRLTALTQLYLYDNYIGTLPPEIGHLTALTHLVLSGNQLNTLPPEIGQLTALSEIDLSYNHLSTLPPKIGRLTSLTDLLLSDNQLTMLPPEIGQLTKLTQLRLANNQLSKLPPEIGQLSLLTWLYLFNCQISMLPPEIGKLTALMALDLSYNQLSTLPSEIGRLTTLESLFLHGNSDLGLPNEVLGPTWEEVSADFKPTKPKEILDYYFSQRAADTRPLNEVRMMLLGRGGAGKTSLVQRLMRDTFDNRQESTTGIALQDWRLPCPGGDPVMVHIWDFAGQVIAHATHQFFLSARSVYVLVLTAREDSQREDAEYWLRLIRAFGSEDGTTSKVLVALNKWATAPVRLDREALREKYPFIVGFMETDCETSHGIAELKARLAEIIGSDAGVREKTGADYFKVREALRKRWTEQHTNYLDYTVFEEVCAAVGVTDKDRQRIMARNLHRLGLALNYGDDERLRDTTALNPHWVTDGIYLLLREAPNERAELSLEAACRRLPKEDPRRVMFLIRLMQKYDLAFPLKEDEQLWLVPQALADSQPWLGAEWQGEATRLRWTYAAIPEGLVPRFITRTHTLSEGLPRWLNGTLLELGQARAVVRADVTDRRITATILGPEVDRQRLAGTIQAEMRSLNAEIRGLDPWEELQMQRAPEVWLPVTGLEIAEKKGQPDMSMLTPQGPVEINATMENNRLTLQDARTDVWKPRVFISYSYKDDAAKDQLVLKLKVLQTLGLVEYWLDRDLTAGDEWNRGITAQLEEMDVFVLLVSDHSLTSDYINRVEITRALERCEKDTAEVVPVILNRCQWKASGRLNHLIALPKDAKPIKDHRPQRDGWHDVAEGLSRVLEKLKKQHAGERRSSERERGMR